jgi:hypothetical protein
MFFNIILLCPRLSHHVINSNRRHGSETLVKAIVSDLEKQDTLIPSRSEAGLVDSKKETHVSVKLISEMRPLL